MPKKSREHSANEFGRADNATRGVNAPSIGAPTTIVVDALVERESGHTPSPWSMSVVQIVVAVAVIFLIGLVLLAVALWANPHANGGNDSGAVRAYVSSSVNRNT